MNRHGTDEGLSLIELIIYIVVLGILGVGSVTIFLNMWKTQANIDAQTQGTAHGQLVGSEIEKAMRNATGFQVISGGNGLIVQTTFPGARQCQEFSFDATGGVDNQGTLSMAFSAAPARSLTARDAWQDGLNPASTLHPDGEFTALFTAVGLNGHVVTVAPAGVHYSFKATAPDRDTTSGPVTFSGSAFPRDSNQVGDVSTCWP